MYIVSIFYFFHCRKCGIIVSVSSMTSLQPCPLLNVYAATKVYEIYMYIALHAFDNLNHFGQKFIDYFSDGLRYEYKSKGIIVQV